jgi:hypothetical protein
MTFARLRPSGLWVPRTAITPEEWEQFDENLSSAIDGADGGAYAPSNPIEIGGDGVIFSGEVTFDSATGGGEWNPGTVFEIGGAGIRLSGATTDITWPGTELPKLSSRSYTYVQPLSPSYHDSEWSASAGSGGWVTGNNASNYAIQFPLHLPLLGTLTALTVYIDPKAGHVGLPSNKPRLTLWRKTLGSTPDATVDEVFDAPADVTAYQLLHSFSLTGLSETLASTKYYYAEFAAESGTNALDNLQLVGLTATVTVTQIAP